ncbi:MULTISPECIES: hypothetical protein [unclassified Bradyrhizobium]|uniref:hypothetical protein n=1 Tax=unclassified Bradyrhizobium TaxID=2631580 RepID=UPI002449F5BC|nr:MULTISPECIES: hypothetical protein [unclassified Bradyrhizobium]MDH2347113.1 hypothetical protein [Bradyrhizobium sp. SSUT77]MDH2357592.1 hypothetical protein [Bradyrhizobium sp. SSUT112]
MTERGRRGAAGVRGLIVYCQDTCEAARREGNVGRSSHVTYPHCLHWNIVTVRPVRGLNISDTATARSLPTQLSQIGKFAAVRSVSFMAQAVVFRAGPAVSS